MFRLVPGPLAPAKKTPAAASKAASGKAAFKDVSNAPEKAPAKTGQRQRLKPETREQLLDRLRNPELSLHEASILLRVSRATVRRYADSHQIPCSRTPGGQRRFRFRDVEAFYVKLKTKP